jgi:lincosamide nucleotidyltransferase A/C/D/E
MIIEAANLIDVMRRLERAGGVCYIAGGWGIDALVGFQSRSHEDLDLCFDARHEIAAVDTLRAAGYELVTDLRPVRFVMRDTAGREIDLHPVAFDDSGAGVQQGFDGIVYSYPADGFANGTIAGVRVPCLSAALQAEFHSGYELKEKDRRDVDLLRQRFGVGSPDAGDVDSPG